MARDKLAALRIACPPLPAPFVAAFADRVNNPLAVIVATLEYVAQYWTPRSGDADDALTDARAATDDLRRVVEVVVSHAEVR